MLRLLLTGLVASTWWSSTEGYKILGFFPFPAPSHQNIFAPVLYSLAAAGHQVVYLTPVKPRRSHPNLEVRLIRQFHQDFSAYLNFNDLGQAIAPRVSHIISNAFLKLADRVYGQEAAQRIIHGTETFDAVLIESYFAQEAVSALAHKFGCPAIEISTLGDCAWVNELAGLPNNPAYQLDFKSALTEDLSPVQRLYNAYVQWSTVLVSYFYLWKNQAVMDQYFNYTGWESRPPLRHMISNRSLILVNQDFVLNYPQPLPPHMKNIGGVNLLPNQPLPQDLQKYMDEAPHGVIYFSLGSNLKTSEITSGDFGKAFMDVFRRLPQKVLMKWESDIPHPDFPKNVRTAKWLPQQDVLAHPNCKLFITHGGFLSITEAVHHGVPILGIPFFGDQPKNMRTVEHIGFGLRLLFENVTAESVSWALSELLDNPRYKSVAVERSSMLSDRRGTAQEEAVYWIEYAIRHPNALTPKAAFLSFWELHLLDLTLFVIAILATLALFINILLYRILPSKSQKKLKTS